MRLLVRLHPVGLGDGGCRCVLRKQTVFLGEAFWALPERGPLTWNVNAMVQV